MTITTSLNPKLLRPGLREVWGTKFANWTPEYTEIFKDETSTLRYEEYQELAPFGLIPEQPAGGNVNYDNVMNGYTQQIVNVAYGMGYKVTREMIDDNQYKQAMNLPAALADSAILTVETIGANVLNRAFNGSYLMPDGSTLCATAHTLPSGGTAGNRPSADADLSSTSIEQAYIDISAFKDPRGNLRKIVPKKLIVCPNDYFMATQLVGSEYIPETANNAVNPIFVNKVLPNGFAVNHYLTDTDAWFILTDQDGLVIQKRVWPAELRDENDFESMDIKQATYFRLAFGAYNWRAIYGSAGA